MARTIIRNLHASPVTLPLPYNGVLRQGDACVVDDTESNVISALGGQDAVRNVFDIFPLPSGTLICTVVRRRMGK